MTKMRADAMANRARIVASARELYRDLGSQAPLDAIAVRAGVGNATLYRHFPDPADLRLAVLTARLDEVAEHLASTADGPDPWKAFTGYLRWITSEPDLSLTDVLLSAPTDLPAVAARRQSLRADLRALIRRAQDAGVLRPGLTVDDLNVIIFALSVANAEPRITGVRADRLFQVVTDGLRV